MATADWNIPTGREITGSTFIKETDNHLSDTIADLVKWVNSTTPYTTTGLSQSMVDVTSAQTIAGIKTFTAEIVANGGITGDVTGNADTATLATTSTLADTATLAITSTLADESTTLTGLTSTVAELNFSDGVTSNIQTQIDAISTTSGSYTPTVTASSNVSSVSSNLSLYTRIGDIVTVHGSIYIRSTVVGSLTNATLSLPITISSNFSSDYQASGLINGEVHSESGGVYAKTGSKLVSVIFKAESSLAPETHYFQFSYQAI